MDANPALLLATADVRVATLCQQVARQINCELVIASDKAEAEWALSRHDVGVALIDADTSDQYLDLARRMKERSARVEVIIAQSGARTSAIVEAIKAGASDYIEKPLNGGTLEQAISRALNSYATFKPSVVPLEEVIKAAITHAVIQAEGDKVKAARLLAIGKTTLYRKLREYGEHTERKMRRSSKKRESGSTNEGE